MNSPVLSPHFFVPHIFKLATADDADMMDINESNHDLDHGANERGIPANKKVQYMSTLGNIGTSKITPGGPHNEHYVTVEDVGNQEGLLSFGSDEIGDDDTIEEKLLLIRNELEKLVRMACFFIVPNGGVLC